MYSYEDRIRAVKLYIKLGKRIRATIRQLGYPSKNGLMKWYREYERGHDLPVASVLNKSNLAGAAQTASFSSEHLNYSCSAKTGDGVIATINSLASRIEH